jgi:homoserine kinase
MRESAPDRTITAFAPATVANVAVGFDVLGFALGGPGDRVKLARDPGVRGISIDAIEGVVTELPREPERNTASVALRSLLDDRGIDVGLRLSLVKGIPLGSGMGGSAASAVAAVVAADRLLGLDLGRDELLRHALEGERAASGAAHADNAAPCLWGGLTAAVAHDPPEVVELPLPAGILCTLVHPRMRLDTRTAREVLPKSIPIEAWVEQSMHLAGFLVGCFRADVRRIGRSMVDGIVGPARAGLIPGFARAREGALSAGALGFAIAGSGPSVFAWSLSAAVARDVERAVRLAFREAGLESDSWVSPISPEGARIEG